METKFWSFVDVKILVQWLLIAAMVAYFIYKEWPGFWQRIKTKAQGETQSAGIAARLDRIEEEIAAINEKLSRDYGRINNVELKQEQDRKALNEIKIEQGIIMRALLGALNGLQELGANGGTESAKEELIGYLNRQAHNSNKGE